MSIQISVVGTVATEPKLLNSAGKTSFCTFRVASNERRYDREKNQWVDGETTWLSVNAFRSLAEHAQQSFSIGDRVIVNGKLRVKRWESQDRKGVSVELDAEGLGHDLRWGVSTFTKRMIGSPVPDIEPVESAATASRNPTNATSEGWLAPATASDQGQHGDGFGQVRAVAA
ncbi:single-stranded DNA-binding protein [Leucobacter viscericola]|uniref:Single-stranded DNA-binding protein n=1 Tax=Leucobacter viscericola TaxID=2714935 RepID=A0A6G7XIZ4_9MICO|nr:single-stranded DNA-binding protein [Leucobacter viscericola]QIK64456.1 single-stranded DNA-binding protein [Leucobacter viscericola]